MRPDSVGADGGLPKAAAAARARPAALKTNLNAALPQPPRWAQSAPMPIIPLCAVLLALPWLWPFTAGPMATTLPYLVAAGVAAVLLVLWPRDAERGATVAATG